MRGTVPFTVEHKSPRADAENIFRYAGKILEWILSGFERRRCKVLVVGDALNTKRLFLGAEFAPSSENWLKFRQLHFCGRDAQNILSPGKVVPIRTYETAKEIHGGRVYDDGQPEQLYNVVVEILGDDALESRVDVANVPCLVPFRSPGGRYLLFSPFRVLSQLEVRSIFIWYPHFNRFTLKKEIFTSPPKRDRMTKVEEHMILLSSETS